MFLSKKRNSRITFILTFSFSGFVFLLFSFYFVLIIVIIAGEPIFFHSDKNDIVILLYFLVYARPLFIWFTCHFVEGTKWCPNSPLNLPFDGSIALNSHASRVRRIFWRAFACRSRPTRRSVTWAKSAKRFACNGVNSLENEIIKSFACVFFFELMKHKASFKIHTIRTGSSSDDEISLYSAAVALLLNFMEIRVWANKKVFALQIPACQLSTLPKRRNKRLLSQHEIYQFIAFTRTGSSSKQGKINEMRKKTWLFVQRKMFFCR